MTDASFPVAGSWWWCAASPAQEVSSPLLRSDNSCWWWQQARWHATREGFPGSCSTMVLVSILSIVSIIMTTYESRWQQMTTDENWLCHLMATDEDHSAQWSPMDALGILLVWEDKTTAIWPVCPHSVLTVSALPLPKGKNRFKIPIPQIRQNLILATLHSKALFGRNNSGIKDEICTCYSTTRATLCRKQLSVEPLTLLRFYSDEPRHQSGEMDTLQTYL